MKTRILLQSLALALGLASLASPLAAASADRPNILYFYVDDMGWGSVGPNGQAARRAAGLPSVRTPNLDRLAAEGINFTRAYGCTVCSPARSSQQSGFHQGHTFADRNDPDNAKKAMRADDILMGDALSAAGYVTGYWGKWGYGGSKDQANPVIENIQTLPTSHGYKHVLAELHHVRAHTFFQPTLWHAPAAKGATGGLELIPNTMAAYAGNDAYPDQPALQNHADYPATGYCDDLYAFHALDFVRTQAQNYNAVGQPFFGLLAVQIPHAPFDEIQELPEWDAAYEDDKHFASLADQTREWAAMVTRIDAHFGNILAALEDPNHDGDSSDSVADDTLVIFMSDNGGPGGKNNIELDANGGLRGNKGSIQEGGIRVPAIMRWPAKITAKSRLKAGTNSDMVIDVSDLLPTFCELAGAEIPLGIDGVSLAPVLTGSGERRPRDFVIHEAGNGQSIIRGKHKLVRSGGASKKRGANKKNAKPKEPALALALYNLEADHAEENNIAASNGKLVAELEALLLGERVAEERGFANTYHHWEGKKGAKTSSADNWSDYVYENAGIAYMEDRGAPQLSWTARIDNGKTAFADKDLEFLALEIRGEQELVLGKGVNLTGRNEIRISPGATLTVDGGTVSSLRWVDLREGATLRGKGKIEGELYNRGTVELTFAGEETSQFHIAGNANLGGTLIVKADEGFSLASESTFVILTADRIRGAFANPGNRVVADDGTVFHIAYSETAVTLSADRVAAK